MFVRRDDKKDVLIQLDDKEERIGKRFSDCVEDSKAIHKLVQVLCNIFAIVKSYSIVYCHYIQFNMLVMSECIPLP